MGFVISKVWDRLVAKNREVRILMLGLDAAGKTTILYKLKLGEVVSIPTIGFNVETLQYKNINLNVWDTSGGEISRTLWRHYFENTQGLIYVVDSADRERIQEAHHALHELILTDQNMQNIPVLVLANKQDLENVMSCEEITEKMDLNKLQGAWLIQPCSAWTNQGLCEGMDWLSTNLQQ